MFETYQGEMQTMVQVNGKKRINKVHWDADYDGKKANVSLDVEDNHRAKHYDVQLNNEDLAEILNVPSVKMSLEKRLQRDFPKKKRFTKKRYRHRQMIELDTEPILLRDNTNILKRNRRKTARKR